MLQINLDKLKDGREELASLLDEKLRVSSTLEANKLILNAEEGAITIRDVKTYLKKYLHRKGLRKDIKILVNNGQINLVKVRRKEE